MSLHLVFRDPGAGLHLVFSTSGLGVVPVLLQLDAGAPPVQLDFGLSSLGAHQLDTAGETISLEIMEH